MNTTKQKKIPFRTKGDYKPFLTLYFQLVLGYANFFGALF